MRLFLLTTLILFFSLNSFAQIHSNIQMPLSINTPGDAPHPVAILDLQSTNKGILIPRMSTTDRDAIPAPIPSGLMVYVNDDSIFYYYDGNLWQPLGGDDLGNHMASQDLNLNENDIIDAGNVTATFFYGDGSNLVNVPGDGVEDADADPLNEMNTSFVLDTTALSLTDANGTLTVDLGAFDNAAAVTNAQATADNAQAAANIAQVAADSAQTTADIAITIAQSAFNESILLNGNNLEVTDGNGTLVTDLSPLDNATAAADAQTAADNAQIAADSALTTAQSAYNTSILLNGTNLEVTDGDSTIVTDLANLQDTDWLKTDGQQANSISNNIYTNGNVGIGTNSPSFPIDVRGSGGERLRAYSTDSYYAGYLAKNNTREFFMGVQGAFETNDASSGFHIYDNTAGQQRLVIDKDGDVGINQTNPNARLHVNGDVRIVDGTQGVGKVLTSDASGFASWQILDINDGDADPLNEINIGMSFSANTLALTDLGNTLTVDLSSLDNSAAVATAQATADAGAGDTDSTNELITGATLNGTALEITDNGGTTAVDLSSLQDEDWSYNTGTGNAGEVYHLGQASVGVNTAEVNGAAYRFLSQRNSTDAAAIMGYNGTSRGLLGVWDSNFTDVDLPSVQSVGVLGYCPDFSNNSRAAVCGYAENTQGAAYGGMFHAVGANAQQNIALYAKAENSINDNFVGYFIGDKSYFNGNIGLGTTSPTDKLHASSGDAGTKLRVQNTGTGGAGLVAQNTQGEICLGLQSSTDPNPGNFQIYDVTNSLQLMEIQDNQQFKFYGDITGNTLLSEALNTAPHGTLSGGEGLVMPGGTSDYIVSVQDGNGRIQHKWNATIGTNEKYIVSGEDAAFIDLNATAGDNNTPWIEFKHADGANAVAGDAIPWNTHLIINQGGEVGINELSPDDMLHVTSAGNGTRVRAENSSNGWAGLVAKNTVREIFMGVQGAFDANPGEFHIYDNTAGSRRLVIDAAGEVGIGRNNPSVRLDVNGSVNCTGGTCSSDIRWKKDIQPLENALDKLDQLRGVSYNWRSDAFPDRDFEDKPQIGMIAQEVEKVYPDLIHTDNEGFKSLDYMSFTAVLLEAVKSLKKENEILKSKIIVIEKEQETQGAAASEIEALSAELELIKRQLGLDTEMLEKE